MDLKHCPHCQVRVLPMSDDTCPSCGASLSQAETVHVESPPAKDEDQVHDTGSGEMEENKTEGPASPAKGQYKIMRWVMFSAGIGCLAFTWELPLGPAGRGVGTAIATAFILTAFSMGWPRSD